MVGAINPDSGDSINKQRAAAINADFQLSPGQPWPAEGSIPGSQSVSTLNLSSPNSTNSSRLSRGAVVGIVFGILISVALAAAFIYLVWWFKRHRSMENSDEVPILLRTESNDGEQMVPIMHRQQIPPPSIRSPPISPIVIHSPERNMRQVFYKRPQVEREVEGPMGHPAFGNPYQSTTSELPGDEPL
jgi:hypothetical protein